MTRKEIKHANKIIILDKMLSHKRMGVPYEYTHMGTSHAYGAEQPDRIPNIKEKIAVWLRESNIRLIKQTSDY